MIRLLIKLFWCVAFLWFIKIFGFEVLPWWVIFYATGIYFLLLGLAILVIYFIINGIKYLITR